MESPRLVGRSIPMSHRPTPTVTLTPHELRRVSVAADCDPRTVAAHFAGLPVRPSIAARIAAALASLHMADPRRVVA